MIPLKGRVNEKEAQSRVPFFMYKRVDLRPHQNKISAFFPNDFGGDYLLRRSIFRWSNEVEGGDADIAETVYIPRANVYYLDLAQAGSGHSGTEIDPWSIADWQSFLQIDIDNRTIYVKGTGTYTEQALQWDSLGGSYTDYRAWNPSVNGPWRLHFPQYFTNTIYNDLLMCGGILWYNDGENDLNAEFLTSTSFFNMHIIADTFQFICGNTVVGNHTPGGNTFNVFTINWLGGVMQDSIIKTYISAGGLQTLNNCSFEFNTDTAANTYNNCQFFPTGGIANLPDYFSTIVEFMYTNFNYFTIPPDPGLGSPLYPLYENGMYGTRRITIGAVAYGSSTLTEPQPFLITLRKKTSYHTIYEEIPPALISSPAAYKGATTVAAPSPVDNDIFSTLFRGSQRLANKTYNWAVEDAALIEIEFTKVDAFSELPKFCDVLLEGYFLLKNK